MRTDSISGAARIWKVYYQLDYSDLFRISPEDITGPMVTRAEVSCWSKSGMINIYFLENSNHEDVYKRQPWNLDFLWIKLNFLKRYLVSVWYSDVREKCCLLYTSRCV